MASKMIMNRMQKKANGAAFVTDRDEKGEAKAPEKLEVPRLAAKKKKEALPEEPVIAPPPAPVPVSAPPTPAENGKVNPIEYIPTDILIKVIEDMAKEEDFAQNRNKQDALIALTEIIKTRPILPPEPQEGQQAPANVTQMPAPAAKEAPMPMAASSKKADLGNPTTGASPSPARDTGNPEPSKAKIDLGGLTLASFEEEKTAEDYRLLDYKLDNEGVRPTGRMPSMDEQEMGGYHSMNFPENTDFDDLQSPMEDGVFNNEGFHPAIKAAAKKFVAEVEKIANANAGFVNDVGEKGKIVEDGGNLSDVGEAHAEIDEAPSKLNRPATTAPMKLAAGGVSQAPNQRTGAKLAAADMTTSKAVKESESFGTDLKKLYLDAKSLTQVNDTRAVREAVEAIFRAANMFDEATKALSKQQQQEESEEEAQEAKAKNKKSSFYGLSLAASE